MKTANEVEKEFLDGLEKNSGNNLKFWMGIIKASNLQKQVEIQKWLKSERGLKHMEAWMLAAIYLNGGKPVYGSDSALLDKQFEKYPDMRPLFDFVSDRILKSVIESEREVKKTYVSFKKKREFAAVNIKKGEIRLGMDLGERPFDDMVRKVSMTGPMPRISHMVVIQDKKDFNDEVVQLLHKSNERVN
jgi:predicted transport protein